MRRSIIDREQSFVDGVVYEIQQAERKSGNQRLWRVIVSGFLGLYGVTLEPQHDVLNVIFESGEKEFLALVLEQGEPVSLRDIQRIGGELSSCDADGAQYLVTQINQAFGIDVLSISGQGERLRVSLSPTVEVQTIYDQLSSLPTNETNDQEQTSVRQSPYTDFSLANFLDRDTLH